MYAVGIIGLSRPFTWDEGRLTYLAHKITTSHRYVFLAVAERWASESKSQSTPLKLRKSPSHFEPSSSLPPKALRSESVRRAS